MWKNVKAKCGIDDLGWWTKKSSYTHGVSCWQAILGRLKHCKSLMHFEVKDGLRVLFRLDV